ncbi:MAG TPA: hypothetical protein DCG37_01980 [Lachnospiraceae bacterium]|nr:hypothetical protein [Lachnospiraceae bacterium]
MPRIKKVYATDIVAVAYTGSEIPVFEKSEAFWIYAVDETKIVRMQILSVYSGKPEDMIKQLSACRADALICRNFGPKAMSLLRGAGIRMYTFDGGAKAAVNAFAAGKIKEL